MNSLNAKAWLGLVSLAIVMGLLLFLSAGTVRYWQAWGSAQQQLLGGHPTDPHNLWPQPWDQANRKDQWEFSLNRAVCAGRMTLAEAQRKIADMKLWW